MNRKSNKKKKGSFDEFDFTPQIDGKSKSIAEAKYKENFADMSHHEYLFAKGMDLLEKKERLVMEK